MNRREFLGLGASAAAGIAVGKGIDVGPMSVGCRMGWFNPYHNGGSFNFWDGEWNVAGGEHSSEVGMANIGDGSMSLHFPSTLSVMSMGERSLDISKVYGTDLKGHLTLSASELLANFTIEICLSRISDPSVSTGEFGIAGTPNSLVMVSNSATSNILRVWSASGSVINKFYTNDTSKPTTLSFVSKDGRCTFFVNGNKADSAVAVPVTNAILNIGSTYLYSAGSIFSIRVCNGYGLTEDELTSNYAIDARRFGL